MPERGGNSLGRRHSAHFVESRERSAHLCIFMTKAEVVVVELGKVLLAGTELAEDDLKDGHQGVVGLSGSDLHDVSVSGLSLF